MRHFFFLLLMAVSISCNTPTKTQFKMIEQNTLTNPQTKNYTFLTCMYRDSHFPAFLVDKCKNILVHLCSEIETKKPGNLDELYKLTQASVQLINDLEDDFFENDSELETAAAECFASDFQFIATAYGFNADVEELIATRNW